MCKESFDPDADAIVVSSTTPNSAVYQWCCNEEGMALPPIVLEQWVTDSLTQNRLLPIARYTRDNVSKNELILEKLSNLMAIYSTKPSDRFRVVAYRRALNAISKLDVQITDPKKQVKFPILRSLLYVPVVKRHKRNWKVHY